MTAIQLPAPQLDKGALSGIYIFYMARIIISIPQELLDELDKYVKENQYNRSECIRHAIRLLIKKLEKDLLEVKDA